LLGAIVPAWKWRHSQGRDGSGHLTRPGAKGGRGETAAQAVATGFLPVASAGHTDSRYHVDRGETMNSRIKSTVAVRIFMASMLTLLPSLGAVARATEHQGAFAGGG